jgi:hypothetical protein
MVGLAETQRVHNGDGTRAHSEHIAQDAADAGGGALERLDEARVVVAFHFENGRQPLADIDRAGVLPRAVDDVRRLGREFGQVSAARLVGTVLAPHDREHAQFGDVRRAAELFERQIVLVAGKAEFFGKGQRAWRERV